MDKMIETLFEAHLRHEVNRFKPKAFQQTVREETAALFQWLKRITLREIVTPEQIIGVIERNVVKLPIAGGITELTGEMSRRVLASPQNRAVALKDIFPRKSYDEIVDKIGGLENARQDLIHHLVNSSIYSQQISEVLFTGIKEYLLEENIIAQKIPGVASLIKLGKLAVNKTLHPLEIAVEKTVKHYIEKNLGNTIRRTEKSLNAYFDEAHIIEMGDEIWTSVSGRKLAEYFKMVNADDLEDFIVIGYDFWLYFRKTPYFKAIYTDLVHFFFEKYGDRELDLIAEDVGVTEKMVANELVQTLSHGIKKALADGYLEARIRSRLENFYQSPETEVLLSRSLTETEKPPLKAKMSRASAAVKTSTKKRAAKKSPPKGKK